MKKIFLVSIIILAAGMSACNTSSRLNGNNKITNKTDNKKPDTKLVENHWKLIELNGQAVNTESGNAKEPHIIFKTEDNMVVGNGGCNSFHGVYTLGDNNSLSFPMQLATTKMMCINMGSEDEFMKIFEDIENYTIEEDTLTLNSVAKNTSARFVVVTE